MTTGTKKRPPSDDELKFIEVARQIRSGQLNGNAPRVISSLPVRWHQETASELHKAYEEDSEAGFWTSYDTIAHDRTQMQAWRDMVKVAPEKAAEKKERSYPLHPLSYLKNLPKRKWGVSGILLDKGLSAFVGDGGSGKTTFKFEMDIARAIKKPFIGRETNPAFVIWVAGESIDELYDRALGTLQCNGLTEDNLTNFLILDGAMPFNNSAEVASFIQDTKEQLEELGVSPETHSISFTFDTYARCTPGADENSTQDTKLIVDSMGKIRDAFQAHVSIIHHTNAKGTIRGNTAFRDALDTMWIVTKDGNKMTLTCDKMRGKETPPAFQVEMRSVLLDPGDDFDRTAPVIFSLDEAPVEKSTPRAQLDALEILHEAGTLSSNDWHNKCEKAFKMPYTTWNNIRKALETAGYVETPKDTPRGKKKMYSVTKLGDEVLG